MADDEWDLFFEELYVSVAGEAGAAVAEAAACEAPETAVCAFTDGACIRNGTPDAEASFALHVVSGPVAGVSARGRVGCRTLAFRVPGDPAAGFAATATPAIPTNNRGEYLAHCWLLLFLLRGGGPGPFEVVTDCNLFIQSMEVWLPARRLAGTAAAMKNFDLLELGEGLLAALRRVAPVTLTHIRSHKPRPPGPVCDRPYMLWAGNVAADAAAGRVLSEVDHRALVLDVNGVCCGPCPLWDCLGRDEPVCW